MVNFGPLAAEIASLVWGTPGNFNGFRDLGALLHGTLVVGVSQTAALNRGCHLHSAGRPSRWALAHISSYYMQYDRLDRKRRRSIRNTYLFSFCKQFKFHFSSLNIAQRCPTQFAYLRHRSVDQLHLHCATNRQVEVF